jgi:hypothetical protein
MNDIKHDQSIRKYQAERRRIDMKKNARTTYSDTHTYAQTFVYIKSEPKLWTVGFYDPAGRFQPDSDHDTKQAAAHRVCELNGAYESLFEGRIKSLEANVAAHEKAIGELQGAEVIEAEEVDESTVIEAARAVVAAWWDGNENEDVNLDVLYCKIRLLRKALNEGETALDVLTDISSYWAGGDCPKELWDRMQAVLARTKERTP